jgi:hypothetical protein
VTDEDASRLAPPSHSRPFARLGCPPPHAIAGAQPRSRLAGDRTPRRQVGGWSASAAHRGPSGPVQTARRRTECVTVRSRPSSLAS